MNLRSEPVCSPPSRCKERADLNLLVDRRQYYIKELGKLLDKLESDDCPPKDRCIKVEFARPTMNYPGYVEFEKSKKLTPLFQPLVTNIQVKEIRTTSDYKKTSKDASSKLEFVPISVKKYCDTFGVQHNRHCECEVHNGLQENCEMTDCDNVRPCLTQPHPSCATSLAYGGLQPPPARKMKCTGQAVTKSEPAKDKIYCCCSSGPKIKEIENKNYVDCNHYPAPDYMQCYTCKQIKH